MSKREHVLFKTMPVWGPVLIIAALVTVVILLLRGNDVMILNPKGLIASEQRKLTIISVAMMLVIGLPTLAVFYFTAWKYRESNKKATFKPNARHSRSLDFRLWAMPSIIVIALAAVMWPATHRLAPQKAIANDTPPLAIQVVALRWKWLFIYPDQGIATVNFLQVPVGTPLRFELAADETPMSSFWIPHLGGQLYAMTGHVNRLNLIADEIGTYEGSSAEINGEGFAHMRFMTQVSSMDDFTSWLDGVRRSPETLDKAEYERLLRPSEKEPPGVYATADLTLYNEIVKKYAGTHGQGTRQTEHE